MEFTKILETLIQEYTTQQALANKIGVKQSQISEWLKGKAKPGYDTLKTMVLNLNVSPYFLLGLKDEDGTEIGIYNNYGIHNGDVTFNGGK